MIRLIDVSKLYPNGVVALNHVSIDIEKGEFVFLVGQSGAGKSTFMKMLLKEEEPSSGKLMLDGEDVTKLHRRRIPFLRRKMGVVFQDFRLLPNKTVYENVAYAMEILGEKPREIRRHVPMILSMVGLSDKAKHYPNQLSGGEQQRVSIARAMINNPPLLIADEPTGNLDPDTSWEIMKLLRQINRRGTTIVMATHDKEIVDTMQKRVITLDKGNLVRDNHKGGYGHEI
ncbi:MULTISPECIES: cell division ATP-binding protein FtsE [unclassified Fusibacter]|uniref:cell division ATP-binding protein FtsE n=1 Tax=unclassified Fusibacter TaxID=2624464 RepID=UPI0010107803|nr:MULTISPECIES: cell division ATP-binding protein FtsE [unclassified Fusibacter]MCK8060567.1 cell division ATP-binding protein FtsE [Fusibacter sp. A2]NPE22979.1 cell division ATP-binding protein FtsE [Fusibacter sp. A1]RXV60044.1 cell division ATP-binding protein FtsE [Fusibacter sp. A1]